MKRKLNTKFERPETMVDRMSLQSQVGAMAEETERLVS